LSCRGGDTQDGVNDPPRHSDVAGERQLLALVTDEVRLPGAAVSLARDLVHVDALPAREHTAPYVTLNRASVLEHLPARGGLRRDGGNGPRRRGGIQGGLHAELLVGCEDSFRNQTIAVFSKSGIPSSFARA